MKRFANILIVLTKEYELRSMLLSLIFDIPSSSQDFNQKYHEEISKEYHE
jgi:hypothetical protein